VLEKLGGGLANASQEQLFFYLKTYCKLIGCHHSGYRPTLSHCASVVSLHRDVLLPEFHDNSIVSPGFEQPTKTDSKTDTKDSVCILPIITFIHSLIQPSSTHSFIHLFLPSSVHDSHAIRSVTPSNHIHYLLNHPFSHS
jgi:hypothetical protein